MALNTVCSECPERVFDNPGSARGHANRVGHHLVEVQADLVVIDGKRDDALEDYPILTGELGAQLDALAEAIRAQYDVGRKATGVAWKARFAIGAAMVEARRLLRGDLEFGRWVKDQAFPFGKTYANLYRRLGEKAPDAQQLLDTVASRSGSAEDYGFARVVREIDPPAPREPRMVVSVVPDADEDTVASPALTAIRDLLFSNALNTIMDAPLTIEYWDVPADERASASHEFKLICERLIAINKLWQTSG